MPTGRKKATSRKGAQDIQPSAAIAAGPPVRPLSDRNSVAAAPAGTTSALKKKPLKPSTFVVPAPRPPPAANSTLSPHAKPAATVAARAKPPQSDVPKPTHTLPLPGIPTGGGKKRKNESNDGFHPVEILPSLASTLPPEPVARPTQRLPASVGGTGANPYAAMAAFRGKAQLGPTLKSSTAQNSSSSVKQVRLDRWMTHNTPSSPKLLVFTIVAVAVVTTAIDATAAAMLLFRP